MPEGRVVFAGEPLLEVTAPVAEAQLAETVLLNHVTFQASVATKAARCVLAAYGAQVVDFAFRRTQGIEAGLAAARVSAIAGFTATSNVEAARRYGLTAAGTMAHSFIEAFPSEALGCADEVPCERKVVLLGGLPGADKIGALAQRTSATPAAYLFAVLAVLGQ